MHILIVSQYFWPENFRINDITKLLIGKGHSVTVLTGIPNYPDGKYFPGYGLFKRRKEKYNNANIIRIPLISRGNGKGFRLFLNYLSFVIFGCICAPFYKIPEYDLIFVYEPSPITVAIPAILLKKIKRVPLVFYVLDLWPESISAVGAIKSLKVLNAIKIIVNYIYKNCDKILVPSKGFIRNIKNYNIDSSKITYWPQWAEEIFSFDKNISRQSIEKLPTGFRIVFAGNIGTAQGLEIIIDAAKILKAFKNIYWIIIGDGRMKEWFEDNIKKYHLAKNIFMLGRKPIEIMPEYFLSADCLFLSLKQDPVFSLTLPAKIQTYLACGKPIVAAIDGESVSIINNAKAGLTSPSSDPQKLADNVLKLYKMKKSERNQFGLNGRRYFEKHFKSDLLLTKLISIFENIIK
jgi:colanic acid biosynthesis glycosyl transferase WcaI